MANKCPHCNRETKRVRIAGRMVCAGCNQTLRTCCEGARTYEGPGPGANPADVAEAVLRDAGVEITDDLGEFLDRCRDFAAEPVQARCRWCEQTFDDADEYRNHNCKKALK